MLDSVRSKIVIIILNEYYSVYLVNNTYLKFN